MTAPIIIFTFAGRRPNVELLRPYIERILAEHSNARWEIWNLARDPRDAAYLRTIEGDRIVVRHDFYNPSNWWASLNEVWREYARSDYKDAVFVKTDDDLAFVETDGLGDFVNLAVANPNAVISALTVNNGASTPLIPGINRGFERLNIPLLDVHMSNDYAEMAHGWFFDNWKGLIKGRGSAPTEDWVSINLIAYTWQVGKRLGELVGTVSPRHIAGRDWREGSTLGDEGAVNMLPRIIDKGLVAAHLTFGPQQCPDEQQDRWRARYAEIAEEYLA
ncbi:glycosyltransferase [Mycobacterium phage ThreeRngTarjay]|uniref:Glycosyltransferase n=1 Tax=Mycobacterium phage Baka TaxID=2902882 RepID=G1CZX3_9CAUD|nr:glycosyltransferase [Mycobacterium phage Baka]AXQ52256.1 glycosyltransferase [Mycobacterium phage EricMillard]QBI99660.1 glycosyltransferase [Mycobacterium phage ThreeRngTarjay]QBI99969.1 glycosyltransferase [Mycobacterium phage Phoebus]QDM55600.1 glycosyltransferase [Mycobacterium phage HokkenD]QQM15180.1 glycosyltransferase [Mycobacterium phage Pound]